MSAWHPNVSRFTFFDVLYALLVVLFPCVYVSHVIDPVLVPRQAYWGLLMCAMLPVMLFRRREWRSVSLREPVVWTLLCLPLVYLASAYQSISITESWYTLSKWALFSSFPVVTYILLASGQLNRTLICACVMIAAAFACTAVVAQVMDVVSNGGSIFSEENLYQVRATFGHKNLLSSFLFLCIPFCASFALNEKRVWRWIAVALLAGLGFLILLLQTRAVLAGIAVALTVVAPLSLWVFRNFPEFRRVRIAGIALLAVIIAAGSFVFVKRDVFSMLTRTESMRERISIWSNTAKMIADHPLTGVGAGNWQIHFPKYGLVRFHDTNYLISEGLTTFQRPHNDFLWVFAETGVAGFLLYAGLFVLMLACLWRWMGSAAGTVGRIEALVWIFVLAGYIVIACFDFPLERMEHQLLLGLFIALAMQKGTTAQRVMQKELPGWLPAAFLVAALFSLRVCSGRYHGEKHSYKLIVAHQQGAWQRMIAEADKAGNAFYNMDPFSIPLAWYSGVAYFTLGDLQSAKSHFAEAYRINPYQVHVLNNYATCFEKEGRHGEAIRMFEEMYRISPVFSDGIINLSGAYFNAGRYEDAYRVLSTFRWDDQHPRSHQFMAAIMGKKLELMLEDATLSPMKRQELSACQQSDSCIWSSVRAAQAKGVSFDQYLLEKDGMSRK